MIPAPQTALPDGQVDFLNLRWVEYTGGPGRPGSCLSGAPVEAAVRGEDPTAGLSSTVSRPFDPFIERAEELQTVQKLLATHRLVILWGAAKGLCDSLG